VEPEAIRGISWLRMAYNRRLSECNHAMGLRFPAEAIPAFHGFSARPVRWRSTCRGPPCRSRGNPRELADGAESPHPSAAALQLCQPGPWGGQPVSGGDLLRGGSGPVRMRSLAEGDCIRVLGRSTRLPGPAGKRWALLVAGGMGAPPIQHLARLLASDRLPCSPSVLPAQGRCANCRLTMKPSDSGSGWFSALGLEWQVATDDGSRGHHGFVTECLERWLGRAWRPGPKDLVIYGCGPEPMLAQVARIAKVRDIDCQVSLERQMACGFGVCQACAVECMAPEGQAVYRLCCQDGPVMDAWQVVF